MYLCEMIFAIFCLYFIQTDIGYECIVFSCIVEILEGGIYFHASTYLYTSIDIMLVR